MRRKRDNPFSLFSFQDIITGLCGIMVMLVLVMLVDVVVRRDYAGTAADEPPIVELDDDLDALRAEIARLRAEFEKLKEEARLAIVSMQDAAAPEERAKLASELNEREREVAALLSQVKALVLLVDKAREADAEGARKVAEMEATRRLLSARLHELKDRKVITLIPERGEYKIPVFVVCGRGGMQVMRPIGTTTYRSKWYPVGGQVSGLADELAPLDKSTHTVILLVRPSGVAQMDELAGVVKRLGFTYGRDPLEEDVEISLAKAGEGTP